MRHAAASWTWMGTRKIDADSVAGSMPPVNQVIKVDDPMLIEVAGTRRIIAFGNTSIFCVVKKISPDRNPKKPAQSTPLVLVSPPTQGG
jgi:hypothetical protein